MNTSHPRRISLALAGGNALGAFAAGAYEALHESGLQLDIVAGASIGAINATIIAGNPPELRVERLREFWRQAGLGSAFGWAPPGGRARDIYNKMHVVQTLLAGRPGMFAPRPSAFMSMLPGMPPDVGLFDPRPMIGTLERLVDFDLLNRGALPLVISATDIERGEPVYFDSRRERISPHHVLASTAFVPGFLPVEIDGRTLVDPGMYCNMPLDPLLDPAPDVDQLCFAVDLFEARGQRPFSLDSALERTQDILFSSQTLRTLEAHRREHRLRYLIGRLAANGGAVDGVEPDALAREGRGHELAVALLAYQPPAHELGSKMVEYSRASIDERWAAGLRDMRRALAAVKGDHATTREPGYTFYDARRPAENAAAEAGERSAV